MTFTNPKQTNLFFWPRILLTYRIPPTSDTVNFADLDACVQCLRGLDASRWVRGC